MKSLNWLWCFCRALTGSSPQAPLATEAAKHSSGHDIAQPVDRKVNTHRSVRFVCAHCSRVYVDAAKAAVEYESKNRVVDLMRATHQTIVVEEVFWLYRAIRSTHEAVALCWDVLSMFVNKIN